ncbi:macrophage mannose receptor 1-like isoform X2 [Pimephales promelas]|uniref:macrophage mannose receptor 1-like isoform X2 n=1 Tax=Pimephales promelas TaxID=90988 RepID=UPI001955D7C6|nr:macrophage mannose receptor 1-like isoform X2 [Pimephales promelas]
MDRSVFVLLLSGLLRTTSGVSRQYHYINVRMSWPEAQSYCREKYTDLATVDTMDDVNRLVNIVDAGYSGSVWIGLKRGTQTRWVWSNGENTLTQYSAWYAGEPKNENKCGFIANGVWKSYSCSNQFFFMCYSGSAGYVRVEMWKNWMDAQSYCRQYYTDLPTIDNSEKLNQIKSIIPSVSWVWIGLFQDSWEWSDKWSRFFRNWAAGQPSQTSGSGDCVGMSTTNSGKWAHESCDLKRSFICHGGPKSPYRSFIYVNERKTWQDAQSYCRARFTDLATADNMSDVSLLVNSVDAGYRGSVWIGLHNGTEYRWVWSMGSLSQYSNWYPGEPNGDGECVISLNGRWYDESCSAVLPFVCFNDSTGFIITETALTWRDAQSYCRKQHTDLASISSAEQQNLIGNAGSLWIGLFKDSWEWSDRWNLSFRNWAAGQPSQSSGSGDCVGMATTDTGKWARYSCDLQQPFICYGDDTLIKKQIVRLKLSCNGKCTLNDPSLQTAILNQISEKLKNMGLESDSKISWRKGEGEEVFHQEINRKASSNDKCNK